MAPELSRPANPNFWSLQLSAVRDGAGFDSSSRAALQPLSLSLSAFGLPLEVLSLRSRSPPLTPPPDHHVDVKVLASVINPADLNVVEGRYAKLPPAASLASPYGWCPGNEGVAEVVRVGPGVSHVVVGELVVPAAAGEGGWWQQVRRDRADAFIKIPSTLARDLGMVGRAPTPAIRRKWPPKLTRSPSQTPRPTTHDHVTQAAGLCVAPSTALRMLEDFAHLEPGDTIVQNGSSSAVGLAVVQLARAKGVRTINLVRRRPRPRADERFESDGEL